MIGGAKGIGIGIDFGIPNQYRRATSKPYIEKDVLDSLRVVASAYGKSNNDSDRAVVKNLVDASNPFVISNAAFKLNSGFGKYEEDFTSWIQTNGVIASSDKVQNSITGRFLYFNTVNKKEDVPSFKVNITLGQQSKLQYNYIKEDGTSTYIVYSESGIYTIPASYFSKYTGGNAWFGFYQIEGTSIIEQIPSFQGAFVTDGIDDLITSTKTVQEMLGGSNECTVLSMMCQIGDTIESFNRNNWLLTPTSYLESRVEKEKTGKTGIYGYTSTDISNGQISNINTILGDKDDYIVNSKIESTGLDYFSVEGFQNEGIWYTSSVAWYWTIIANKVLTTDQINQVIAYFNLDRTLNPDILCDIEKQGITNENHAEFGDKLIDFSGNGRDIQLNNIAWNKDSGIGKYGMDFLEWKSNSGMNFTSTKLTSTKPNLSGGWLTFRNVSELISETKVKVSGAPREFGFIGNNNGTDDKFSVTINNGVYTIPEFTLSSASGFYINNNSGDWSNLVIEQIPSHAGALYLDGINDFGKVTGMPIYKDYTIVADREVDKDAIFPTAMVVASKAKKASESNEGGAFIFEYINLNSALPVNRVDSWSFYKSNQIGDYNRGRSITYQSKYRYNDVAIEPGTSTDSDTLWLGKIRDNDSRFFNGAIYSLMSFPYSMSEFLIERQLKKHKLGTLYPDMVEFRPVIKSSVELVNKPTFVIRGTSTLLNAGDYIPENSEIWVVITMNNAADRITKFVINGNTIDIPSSAYNPSTMKYGFPFTIDSKSPQKINITIDEYIRFEDIVQPYPLFFEFTDENGNLISWGGKAKVGSTITRTKPVANANLLAGMYNTSSYKLNGKPLEGNSYVVEKSMVFTCTATWTFDNNEPKSIISPRLLRIPNSSYEILGYIPDISGHGNNGVIHNSAYAEGSGVNEDGSYQFDGVDDFVAIPTLSSGGKQVLMKVNSLKTNNVIYDQRNINNRDSTFCIVGDTSIAYKTGNGGDTYIDGILNQNITGNSLINITHNITITNKYVTTSNSGIPNIGSQMEQEAFAQMALYDFILFDNISTDDKIKELNEYVGIEGNVWGILTQLSNSTLISNETLIKNE